MTRIKGKNILITGGASGIGRKLARRMAKEGANVIIWDIDRPAMDKAASELAPFNIQTHYCDVSDRNMVYRQAKDLLKKIGSVDILINNAGTVDGKSILEVDDEAIEKSVKINTLAHYWTTKAFLPGMIKKNEGYLVTMSSAAGLIGVFRLPTYNTAKFGNFGFNESLRMEFKIRKLKIKTLVVCPYYVDTGMFAGVRTRFPFILPILKEDYVAQKIVSAIKKNKTRLYLPWIVYTIPFFRLFPTFIFDFIATLLGINNSMDRFQGRGKR